MKETYPKYVVNAVVIVLVTIIIAITFTMNSSTRDKRDCYDKVYKRYLIRYNNKELKKELRIKEVIEGRAAARAASSCFE